MIRTVLISLLACASLLVACSESTSSENASSRDTGASTPVASVGGRSMRQWPDLQPPEKAGHKIVVKGKNLPDTVFLAFHMGKKQFYDDTVLTRNGKAVFSGKKSLPGGIYLLVFPPENRYVEVIVTRDQFFEVSLDPQNLEAGVEVEGSEENERFYESQRFIARIGEQITPKTEALQALPEDDPQRATLRAEIKNLNDEILEHRLEFMEKYPNAFYTKVLYAMRDPEVPANPDTTDEFFDYRYTRAHFWDDVDWRDSQLLRTPVLENKMLNYLDRLTVQHPDTLSETVKDLLAMSRANKEVFRFVAITLANKYSKSKIMGQDAVFVTIVEDAYASGEAYWMDPEELQTLMDRAYAISPTLLGRVAPGFTMEDTEGQSHNLYEVPGEYIILYFWDYDCGHCRKVTPKLSELYNTKYHDKGVSLVTVSINGDLEVWKERLANYDLDKHALNLQDHDRSTGFDTKYDLSSTPRLFVLDKDKKIVAKQIAVDQLEEILDRYLDKE